MRCEPARKWPADRIRLRSVPPEGWCAHANRDSILKDFSREEFWDLSADETLYCLSLPSPVAVPRAWRTQQWPSDKDIEVTLGKPLVKVVQ